jgi:hypothetical protein
MPSMTCKCDHRIVYGEIPCTDEWLLISDVAFERFGGTIDAEEVYRGMRHMLLCPKCSRLWLYWDGFSKPPVAYGKE